MAQQTFNNGDSGSTVRTALNANANDAESRIATLEAGTYGGIHADDNAGNITLTLMSTYYQYDQFEANSPSSNMTPDYTNDQITIDVDGDYLVICSITAECSTPQGYNWAIFNNGTQVDDLIQKLNQDSYRNTLTISGIVALSDGDVLDLRVRCITAAAQTAGGRDVNLSATKVGD